MYIGKEITSLASFTEINGEYYMNLEFIGRWKIGDLIKTIEYDYPMFHLSMDCFWAKVISGQLVLKEAEAAKWLAKEEIESVKWLPADEEIINELKH